MKTCGYVDIFINVIFCSFMKCNALTLSLRNIFLGIDGIKICYVQLCIGYFVMVFLLF